MAAQQDPVTASPIVNAGVVPPIEVALPDLSRWADANSGVPYVWQFASTKPGPHVVVQALTHGNEVCGAIALDWLLGEGFRPQAGCFSAVFANVAAYRSFDRNEPFASRCVDEDFNRLWSSDVLDGSRASSELVRARDLRPIYDSADYLLDLHSMTDAGPPLALAGRRGKGLALARAIGTPAHIVVDAGHAAGKRLRDYAFFDDEADRRNALLVECGQHWERGAPDVAKQAMLRFLDHFDMLEPRLKRAIDATSLPRQRVIEITEAVTIASDGFRFVEPVAALGVVPRRGTVIARDGDRDVTTPYDDCVLVMPTRRPKRGETAVRLGRYVD
ncbi:MAG TPA: succinylglutamate desuccinylase/aspartoacylase family protein [Casimicrobiaceae bacterium]|nr:succinylglutamate desuccinylase/aspartoacylase family protein [Casimicrobiaceae bacterium]